MSTHSRKGSLLALGRAVFDLLVVITVTLWPVFSFALPLPGLLYAVGTAVAALVVWALFLSPRPVLRADRYARALIALVFFATGAAAALALGVHWALVAPLFVAAAAITYFETTLGPTVPGR